MTITDKENGMKWKIKRIDDNSFLVTCYEYFSNIGWRQLSTAENYSRDAVEWQFGIRIGAQPHRLTLLKRVTDEAQNGETV